jgi:deoxyribodipyrimidine photolyase-related protein
LLKNIKTLHVILGDQLDRQSPLLTCPPETALWLAEVPQEATHVPSHKARITLFLSAMRHFRAWAESQNVPLIYWSLHESQAAGCQSFAEALLATAKVQPIEKIRVLLPGEWRVAQALRQVCATQGWQLEVLDDPHFYRTPQQFAAWAQGKKQLRLEYWYRKLRQEEQILLDDQGKPLGGQWNFDEKNRQPLTPREAAAIPPPLSFPPDAITKQVMKEVEKFFPHHPGILADFAWPLTPTEAQAALQDFVTQRLPNFGRFQDALWTAEPWLYHSALSAALNLKLLNPREVIQAALHAYRSGRVDLATVEGFVRQILGWREFMRGCYYLWLPDYKESNVLQAQQPLPAFYWTGETSLRCLQESIDQTLRYGYAHHIQRLMVTGLFALLLGVKPKAVQDWYLAVYVDAVEWVELPNVVGMALFADGGKLASKPYVASGKYLQKMSNYCEQCPFQPALRFGETACPFTVLYWDFLLQHAEKFIKHPRLALQVRSALALPAQEQQAIQAAAAQWRARLQSESSEG